MYAGRRMGYEGLQAKIPRMPLSTGQIVNGKYRVIRLLGDGGMGSVYEAHHEVLGTRVALKVLHPELSRTGVARRFLQEARASARIESPHVVRVADADQTEDGLAFIVLEYLEGRTLGGLYDELARDGQKLPFNDALDYAMQMFEGVEAAHAAGIVHRDLKPDNVMITVDKRGAPLLKLLDFGIAKVDEPPESTAAALTRPGALLGTPEYMAPEQVYSAASADVRSDVFSLGVILYEMLSGRRPVLAEDPQQIAVSYLTGAFTRLEDACPGVPPDLARAVHHALAAQPRDRMSSVAELRAAVEPFAPPRLPPSRLSAVGSHVPPVPSPAPSFHAAPAKAYPMPDAPKPRPLPDTNSYPQTPGPGMDGAYPGKPGPSGTTALASYDAPPPPTAPATAFAPDYPSAMGPFSAAPGPGQSPGFAPAYPPPPAAPDGASSPVVAAQPPGFVPEYPPVPPGFGPTSAGSRPSLPGLPGWTPPVSASSAALAPRPGSRRKLWIGVAVAAFLVVASGITLGALYYLGWLDDDPPVKTHKRTPRPAPTARPGGALR